MLVELLHELLRAFRVARVVSFQALSFSIRQLVTKYKRLAVKIETLYYITDHLGELTETVPWRVYFVEATYEYFTV